MDWKSFGAVFVALFSLASAGALENATEWLSIHQNPDGSWGNFNCWEPLCTPWASHAHQNTYGNTSNFSSALVWMISDLENGESWSWAEADIPGAELYAIARSGNFSDLNLTNVSTRLRGMQADNGGFSGWWTENGTIADSVDTVFALRGLMAANEINESNVSSATQFLLSLQNGDGSFNHSLEIAETNLSSLGPDRATTTALSVIALLESGLNASDSSIQNASRFLKEEARACFGENGHGYTASWSAQALYSIGEEEYAEAILRYLTTLQNVDGGFRDSYRTGNESNALDTGLAILALTQNHSSNGSVCFPLETPILSFIQTLYPGEQQNISVNVSEIPLSITGNITTPENATHNLSFTFNANRSQYTALFNETNGTGNYVLDVRVDYIGNTFELEGTFQVEMQPTPTPEPPPVPTNPPVYNTGYYSNPYLTPTSTPTPTNTPTPTPRIPFVSIVNETTTPIPSATWAPTNKPTSSPSPSIDPSPTLQQTTGLVGAGYDWGYGLVFMAMILLIAGIFLVRKQVNP
ncbi:hypothetical protein KJ765_03675 [Candidatus Micrarchaeota archaeon]|nr:hypothetical protein [Candidatus Micrarchaeota archaeon]